MAETVKEYIKNQEANEVNNVDTRMTKRLGLRVTTNSGWLGIMAGVGTGVIIGLYRKDKWYQIIGLSLGLGVIGWVVGERIDMSRYGGEILDSPEIYNEGSV